MAGRVRTVVVLSAVGLCALMGAALPGCGDPAASGSITAQDRLVTAETSMILSKNLSYVAEYQDLPVSLGVTQTYLQVPNSTYVHRYVEQPETTVTITDGSGHTKTCLSAGGASQCLGDAIISSVATGPFSPTLTLRLLRQAGHGLRSTDLSSASFAGHSATCFAFKMTSTPGVAVEAGSSGGSVKASADGDSGPEQRICVTASGILADYLQGPGHEDELTRLSFKVTLATVKDESQSS